jgi:hypothetical protein
MADEIELQVARVVDREALLETLRARGIEAEPIETEGVLGVKVPCADGDSEQACDELLAQMEQLVAEAELPLVPQRGDGFVFLRPPGD